VSGIDWQKIRDEIDRETSLSPEALEMVFRCYRRWETETAVLRAIAAIEQGEQE